MRTWMLICVLLAAGAIVGCENKPKVDPAMTQPPTTQPAAQPLPAAPALDTAPKPPIPPAPPVALPAPPKVDTPAGGTTYVVQARDTLWSIAKQKLGDGKRWKEITAMNPGLTPENLKAGQTIKLPAK
ncbi:MAG: LysM domain protein [Planctomycetes bacterium ADurb.Bin126]|nr:MAG: LysM domain protein [Planctomycetes bacterium ADurb.Bin126]HOD81977.1 LysM domain-containing protein [Phycisphaerae bacterium]HQL74275.1 LysM domain-containing protein [Phycisphaerae bacterium]